MISSLAVKQSKGGFPMEAGVRNRVSGEIEAIKFPISALG